MPFGERLRSIDALEALESSDALQSSDVPRERITLALAELYIDREDGEKGNNLDRAAEHYQRAQSAFGRETHPQEWAAAKVGYGIALMSKIKTCRGRELRPGSKALDGVKRTLNSAIRAYEEAFSVYTKRDCPDDWSRTSNLIAGCRRMAEALSRRG